MTPAWAGKPSASGGWTFQRTVYPRVGGGTVTPPTPTTHALGLSPRGRGNRHSADSDHSCTGSIPAWAGEPSLRRLRPLMHWVYPRVGGGTVTPPTPTTHALGLSPRGRGNPIRHLLEAEPYGSIPAWAGEPRRSLSAPCPVPVYPRVGGGTHRDHSKRVCAKGLSPRGRGNPYTGAPDNDGKRSIPAWAGEPSTQPVFCSVARPNFQVSRAERNCTSRAEGRAETKAARDSTVAAWTVGEMFIPLPADADFRLGFTKRPGRRSNAGKRSVGIPFPARARGRPETAGARGYGHEHGRSGWCGLAAGCQDDGGAGGCGPVFSRSCPAGSPAHCGSVKVKPTCDYHRRQDPRLRRAGHVPVRMPLEVWPESHWPGFALRQTDVFQSYTAL